MAPRDDLVIPPVVFIGPVAAGKSTVAGLLAGRLGWPNLSTDTVWGSVALTSMAVATCSTAAGSTSVTIAYTSGKPTASFSQGAS